MKEERTHFVDSKGSDKRKWYQLLLQTVQKSQQNFVVDKYYKKWLEGYKKKIPIWLADILAKNGLCWAIVHKNSPLPSKLHHSAN